MDHTQIEEAKQFYVDYCHEFDFGEATPWVLVGTDYMVIGNRVVTEHYSSPQFMGPHLRFNADGSVVTGILWGGDVWDDTGKTVRHATDNGGGHDR